MFAVCRCYGALRSSFTFPSLQTLITLTPGIHSVTCTPAPSFLLYVIWPCAKIPCVHMLLLPEDTVPCNSLQSLKSALLAGQFHCFVWYLFLLCFGLISFFIFAVFMYFGLACSKGSMV